VYPVLVAVGDMPRQHDVAVVLGGFPQPYAVAADVAVTYLEVISFDEEAHVRPPSTWSSAPSAGRTATCLRVIPSRNFHTQGAFVIGARVMDAFRQWERPIACVSDRGGFHVVGIRPSK